MPSAEFAKKGSFAQAVLPALLVQATNSRFTGMFRAERESIIKVVYFKEGEIAFASSNQPSDRLGEVLIKRGQLTREQLDMAMSKLEANVSLGRMLVELGYLSPKELLSGAKTQVEEILFSLNSWREGTYEFVEGPLPPRIVDLKLNTKQVVFNCILQVEDRRWVLQQLGSMESAFAAEPGLADALQTMTLDADVRDVIANINGNNTVRDLCARSRLDEFTVTKVAAALHLLNLTRVAVHEAPGGEYLARFGEEEKAKTAPGTFDAEPETTGEPTLVNRPGSETVPGFSPSFGAEPATAPFGQEEAEEEQLVSPETETSRTSPAFGMEEEEAAAPAPDEESPAEDEMAYEEEAVEEEGGGRRWGLIGAGVGLVALLAGAGWYLLRPGAGGEGGKPTPGTTLAQASRSATRPATPTQRPIVPLPSATATLGSSTSATPFATASATASATLPPATPAMSSAMSIGTPSPVATARPATPVATATIAAPTATPRLGATPTQIALGGTPVMSPITKFSPPPTPAATRTSGLTGYPPVPSATRAPKPTPTPKPTRTPRPTPTPRPTRTPKPAPTARETPIRITRATPPPSGFPPTATPRVKPTPRVATAASGGESAVVSGAAFGAAQAKLKAGQHHEAAQAFRSALGGAAGYTIQLEIDCQESSVKDGLGQSGGAAELFIVPVSLHGRSCYRVLWGAYPSRAAAEQAAQGVPAFFHQQAHGRALPIVPLSAVR